MANAYVALQSARVCLADINAMNWTDAILMPYLQEAYRSLQMCLRNYSVDVIKNQTAILLVPLNTYTLNSVAGYPQNLIAPISMMERTPGESLDSFVDMIKTNFVPVIDPIQELQYWSWLQEQIKFVGATMNREVLLRFLGSLTPPQVVTDPLNFIMAENYLGPKVASMALGAISKSGQQWEERAELALHNVIKANMKEHSSPTRRRGYRSTKNWYGPAVPTRSF